jgi:predicted GIY-YIG superfamily endonuclease
MSEEYIRDLCEQENLNDLKYVVYVLRSQKNQNLVYCGMTNNIKRRLRQHNGHIKGGGKYTSANRPWHLAALIPINLNNSEIAKSFALRVEYWTKAKNYPIGSSGASLSGGAGPTTNESGYVCPPKKAIPTGDPIERRVWLLKETTKRHNLPEPRWFDEEFRKHWV